MASTTRHNETEVQVNSVLPSYDCTLTGMTESTGERCLTFPCLHLNRCDRKYRWKVSYLPMPAPWQVWQKVRWIVSYLPVPAPQQVWQKVQVKGVLPSNACTSIGVTESTGEWCLTFLCLHLNRCDRKYRWKVSYLPMPAPQQVWQKVRWIVSYLPVPAPQQVWQKVQVKGVLPSNGVLPSHACTSTGVTESTGERCLTFPCLHLNRCDRKHRWKVSYLPVPAPQQVCPPKGSWWRRSPLSFPSQCWWWPSPHSHCRSPPTHRSSAPMLLPSPATQTIWLIILVHHSSTTCWHYPC